jgi:hypothetical protein
MSVVSYGGVRVTRDPTPEEARRMAQLALNDYDMEVAKGAARNTMSWVRFRLERALQLLERVGAGTAAVADEVLAEPVHLTADLTERVGMALQALSEAA